MKKYLISIFISILATFFISVSSYAQTEGLTLRLSRDFGYGGFNNDIQGVFSMKITGPTDLVRVVFFIDTENIGEVDQPPFNIQFNTDNYPLGSHMLYASGFSKNGQEYQSNKISANFVPASTGTKAVLQIVIPLLVIVFGAMIVSFIVPLVSSRGKIKELPLGTERKYGLRGGICPMCHRPFALPIFSMNLGLSKLARCPYCGKWSVIRIQPLEKLRQAEKAELEWGKAEIKEETDSEKLNKDLDDSKYQGL